MVECPKCGKEVQTLRKKWKYGNYEVESYLCECKTVFRNYLRDGQICFTLVPLKKGKAKKWEKISR